MRFLIINLTTPDDAIVNRLFALNILKDAAYSSKYKIPINRSMNYDYVLVPYLTIDENLKKTLKFKNDIDRYIKNLQKINTEPLSRETYYSIGKFLEKNLPYGENISTIKKYNFFVDVVTEISDQELGVSYTDGSFNGNTKEGGYCCLVLDKDNDKNKEELREDLTGRNRTFTEFSGYLEEATNNSAELTAIKTAIENSNDNRIQVIISDSDLCVKSYRDYINTWRVNGWKKSGKKEPIENISIIQSTDKLLKESKKIYLFKWTEAHVGTPLNDKCDYIAKQFSKVGQ